MNPRPLLRPASLKMPLSPPVTSTHWNATDHTICAKASVSIAEIHAGQLDGKEAEDCRAKQAEQRSEQQADDHRQTRHLGKEGDAIGTKAKIGGMTKRGEPADRHQEMQARGEDHEDRDFRADGQRIVASKQWQRRSNRDRGDRRQPLAGRQRTPGIDGEARCASRGRLRPAEQAPGPDNQHRRHHQKHQDDGYIGEDQDAESVELRD